MTSRVRHDLEKETKSNLMLPKCFPYDSQQILNWPMANLLNFWGLHNYLVGKVKSRWWFQTFFIFTPIWGRFPILPIFFRWVETTNQKFIFFFRVHWLSKNPPSKKKVPQNNPPKVPNLLGGSSHLVSGDRITPHVLSHGVRPFGRRTTLLSGLTNHGY